MYTHPRCYFHHQYTPSHPLPISLNQTQAHYIFGSYTVPDPGGGGGGGAKGHEPPRSREYNKKQKTPDYCWKNVGVGVGTHRAASVIRACKWWDFKISCSLVEEEKTLLFPPPPQSQTKLGNFGLVHLSPIPRLWHVCSLPHLPFRCCFHCKFYVV